MKGLVLEGGGTKGAYQLGAYKALKELGMEFDGIVGTSIGALNAAFIIQGDYDIMEDIWLNQDYKSFMIIEEDLYEKYKNTEFKVKDIVAIVDLMNRVRKNEGIDITPLKNLLKEYIDESFKMVDRFLKENIPQARFTVPEATYFAWVDMSRVLPDVEDLPLFFANNSGVLLEGGDGLFVDNAKGYIRLNLAMPRATIEEGLRRMAEAIEKHNR